jgi:hypothetical protein
VRFFLCLACAHSFLFYVVGTGGVLFEYYVLLNAPSALAGSLRKRLQSEEDEANEDLQLSIVNKFSLRFWYDAIRVMRGVNRKCNKPLALWTMLMEYRGLSRTGRMLASAVHGSLPISTYDKYKKKLVDEYKSETSSLFSKNLGLTTIDNYSHFYNSASLINPVPGSRETQYITCNYTVGAMVRFEDNVDETNLSFVEIQPGHYLDSFPEKLKALSFSHNQVSLTYVCFFTLDSFSADGKDAGKLARCRKQS